uniref:Cleavage stimulation factor 50 kDa subunit n=1 Tax=Globodera pallida TaxID=36090 RepID=A0A183BPP0_GLOPA
MKSDLKDRDFMYKLIVGQLFYDGHQQLALNLAQTLGLSLRPPPPSDKLFRLVTIAKQFVEEPESKEREMIMQVGGFEAAGLDLEFDADVVPSSPEPSLYETVIDTTLSESGPDAHHPVIRTLYDHLDEVTCVAFHPRESILLSGSNDFTLKMFDYSKTAVKRAMKTITVEPITAVSFHPSGEFFLCATRHPTLRLYSAETQQCFVSAVPKDQHTDCVTDVCYSENARMFVTGSRDGNVKVWDGVSNRCIETFTRAHDGAPICSAQFTRNGKYVLTVGMDSVPKLWELSTNRCLIAYTGAGTTGAREHPMQAHFNHTEDYVMLPDEKSGSLCSWDARNSDRERLLALGHTAPTRAFVHSPSMPMFVTGSDDHRIRFWYRRRQWGEGKP